MCMMGRDIISIVSVSIILCLILLTKNYYNIKSNNKLFVTYTFKPSWHSHYKAAVEQSYAAAFS